MPDPAQLYAALDLGTNSCRMLIARPKGAQFHVVDSFSKTVQLGQGLEGSGKLSRASMARTVQALQICRQMWDPADDGPFEGTHYQLAETLCSPLPLSKPEIMVGGGGEKKTLRLVAQYADACNVMAPTVEVLAHKLDVLREHCERLGRDYGEIRVTTSHDGTQLLSGDVDGFVEAMRPYAALGVDTVILRPPTTPLAAWVRDAVAPAVAPVAAL